MLDPTQHITTYSWPEFQNLPMTQKVRCLAREDGSPFHTLFSQQFDRANLDRLCKLATEIRSIAKSRGGMLFLQGLLNHKRAMLYFTQPSSRTFLSFVSACQILGIHIGEVRETSTSSEFKGESQKDSIRTFSSYFDIIIMRTKEKGLAEHMAWVLSNSERPVPIINAGSGKDQHPTQALLDIYTLNRSFERRGGLRNRTVMFIGDLARGRTVRSLSNLLLNYENIKQIFVAPEGLQISQDVLDNLTERGTSWVVSSNMREHLPDVDAIYMTRIQDEWDVTQGESASIDTSAFKIGVEEMRLCKPDAILMHPLPRRDEIAAEVDHDPRAMYWRQVRNGMWMRAALIASTFDCATRIDQFFRENL
ncbi:MAG: aspartate/ornithine carbamoyltransferase family protein [Kiritimatiellia bacterium]|jgi:aspartate carbamoyltransferase catalytic subunit